MAARRAAAPVIEPPPKLMPKERSVKFVSTGTLMLDLPLGGGYAQGRVVNIVGDKSAGKTLLAIEACAVFAREYSADSVRYCEAENAFDDDYAEIVGMPPGIGKAEDIRTVEDFVADLKEFLADRDGSPCLYVLDSLDSLSSAAEMERKEGEASYGTEKAKALSEFFRKEIGTIEKAKCVLLIISQVRDNIGVTFGEKHKRSGGKALDFYCSQVLWLAVTQKIKKTVRGIDRVIGNKVIAKVKKNKVGPPFRETDISIIFSYGVDDEISMLEWLVKNKGGGLLPRSADAIKKELLAAREAQDRSAVRAIHQTLGNAVIDHWTDIEEALAPPMRKHAANE
jgi:recombination protein RecA